MIESGRHCLSVTFCRKQHSPQVTTQVRRGKFHASIKLFSEKRLFTIKLNRHIDMLRPLPRKQKGDRQMSLDRCRCQETTRISFVQNQAGILIIAAEHHPTIRKMSAADLQGICNIGQRSRWMCR